MGYTIRRWMSAGGILFDDSAKTRSAKAAVEAARNLAGIFESVVTDDFEHQIMALDPGGSVRLRKPSIKLTIRVKRTKR